MSDPTSAWTPGLSHGERMRQKTRELEAQVRAGIHEIAAAFSQGVSMSDGESSMESSPQNSVMYSEHEHAAILKALRGMG